MKYHSGLTTPPAASLAVLLAMEDVRSVLVKLACRVHDMQTLGELPHKEQVRFICRAGWHGSLPVHQQYCSLPLHQPGWLVL